MIKNLLGVCSSKDLKLKFVSDYRDRPLNGTCYYNNSICEFKTIEDLYNPGEFIRIYNLSILGKLKWFWRQFLFEQCVGYHWSYKNGKRIKDFYYRNPKWLYKFLFNLYYKSK